ncbi:hypothetical protein [Vibrio diazotrophicus]|uniref:hypothetical protein n=1 Tax=Vibrio diazotrophicus TaxID=685 RepID=UPI003D2F5B53
MGGSSKSSNQTSNTTITENTNLSNAFNADMNGVLLSGIENSTVTVTDGGSVKAALDAMATNSKNAIDSMLASNKDSNDLAKSLGIQALVNAQGATSDAMDIMKNLSLASDAGTAQQMTKYFMLGAVGLAVAIAIRGRF